MLVKVDYTYVESRGVVISSRIHEYASGVYTRKQYVETLRFSRQRNFFPQARVMTSIHEFVLKFRNVQCLCISL